MSEKDFPKEELKLLQFVPFNKNSLFQLILFIASAYIILHIVVVVILILSDAGKSTYENLILPNIGLYNWSHFMTKPWVILTYALSHQSFFEMLSNMLWLFVFGSIVQYYISYKEIVFAYIFSAICGGLLYLTSTLLLPQFNYPIVVNAMPIATYFAFCSLSIAGKRKVLLGQFLGLPIWGVVLVFAILTVLFIGFHQSGIWNLYIIQALLGLFYGMYLNKGARPGTYWFNKYIAINQKFYGAETHVDGWRLKLMEENLKNNENQLTEDEIKTLLDKVKNGGVGSLNMKERGMVYNDGKK